MKKIYPIFLLIFQILSAQNHKIDSLNHVIKTTKNDSIRVDTYNKLSWKYIFSDKEKALEILNLSEKFALETNQKYGYNSFLNNKGIYFDVNGFSDSAKIYFEKAVVYSVKNKFPIQEQYSYNNLGMYAWNKGKYQDALNCFFKALKQELYNNIVKIPKTNLNFNVLENRYQLSADTMNQKQWLSLYWHLKKGNHYDNWYTN